MSNVHPVLRSVKIVGNHFRPQEAKEVFNSLQPKDELILKPEPTNPHDPYAVMVCKGQMHIGYIPKEISAAVYVLAMAGHAFTCIAGDKGTLHLGVVVA